MEKNSHAKKIYGILGNPAKHSLSPLMHNAAFKTLKIKAKYLIFEKKPEELAAFLGSLKKKNIRGLNVTIPYKEKVIPYLDNPNSQAIKTIGSVNTIAVLENGKLRGFNTDYLGFSRHISALKLKPKKVAIIGAGGAAKAVCFALGKRKTQEVCLYDIDKYKALSLFKKLQNIFPRTDFSVAANIEDLKIKDKDLLINASPVGMNKDDPSLVDPEWLYPSIFVYDLIYNPAKTKLLKLAEAKGLAYANGLGMLLYQGARSLEIWIGKAAPVENMRKALMEGLKDD